MRKFKGYVSIGLVGCKREFEFEVEDDASQDEIDNEAHLAASEYLDWSFKETE